MNAHLLMYDEFEVLTCANFEYTMQIQWSMGLQVIYIYIYIYINIYKE